MGQASGLHHHAQVCRIAPVRQGAAQCFAYTHPQRAADTTDFERVRQAGMNMVVAGDRVYLSLAPEAAEGARENNSIMVFMERAAPEFFGAGMRFSKAFSIQQGLPIQGSMLRE